MEILEKRHIQTLEEKQDRLIETIEFLLKKVNTLEEKLTTEKLNITLQQAAEITGYSPASLRLWYKKPDKNRKGFPTPFQLSERGRIFYNKNEIYAFIGSK